MIALGVMRDELSDRLAQRRRAEKDQAPEALVFPDAMGQAIPS